MKRQEIAYNASEKHSQELWKMFYKYQAKGVPDVPQDIFEEQFWPHYEQLVRQIKSNLSNKNRVVSTQKKNKATKVVLNTQAPHQIITNIFDRYWAKQSTVQAPMLRMSSKNRLKQFVIQVAITLAGASTLGALCLGHNGLSFISAIFTAVFIGTHPFTWKQTKLKGKKVKFTFHSDHLLYQEYSRIKRFSGKPEVRLFYHEIEETLLVDEQQVMISTPIGNQILWVPEELQNAYNVRSFLKDLANFNHQRAIT